MGAKASLTKTNVTAKQRIRRLEQRVAKQEQRITDLVIKLERFMRDTQEAVGQVERGVYGYF